jgi:ribosomal protein L6P/L9E
MSRIGKEIAIPAGVTAAMENGMVIKAKGRAGP